MASARQIGYPAGAGFLLSTTFILSNVPYLSSPGFRAWTFAAAFTPASTKAKPVTHLQKPFLCRLGEIRARSFEQQRYRASGLNRDLPELRTSSTKPRTRRSRVAHLPRSIRRPGDAKDARQASSWGHLTKKDRDKGLWFRSLASQITAGRGVLLEMLRIDASLFPVSITWLRGNVPARPDRDEPCIPPFCQLGGNLD